MREFILIAGPCAIEDEETPFLVAETVKAICDSLGIKYIFKSSFKKANRTSLNSFTGIQKNKALDILAAVRSKYNVPVLTDIHESCDANEVAPYVDYLQIPAFLCRQSDLLLAAGETGLHVNIKKAQFLSPEAMRFALEKVQSTGNNKVLLTERGTTFGYNDLVVDMTSIPKMKRLGVPVIMDATHCLQRPNQTAGVTGGDPSMIATMCKSSIAAGADGLFIETHPNPSKAKSDSASMLQLDQLRGILEVCIRVRNAIE